MSERAPRQPMSTGARVAIGLSIAIGALFLIPLLLIGFGAFIFNHGEHGEPEALHVLNACAVPVQFSSDGLYGVPISASDYPWTENGVEATVYDTEAVSIRVLGGPWTPLPLDDGGPYVAEGTGCPPGPTDVLPELVETRAPLLSGAEIISVEVNPSSELEGTAPRSEVTRIVAKVAPEQATAWSAEYAMAASGEPGTRDVPGVAPDAQWVASGAFDAAVSAGDDLEAVALIDAASGTVDLLLYEFDSGS